MSVVSVPYIHRPGARAAGYAAPEGDTKRLGRRRNLARTEFAGLCVVGLLLGFVGSLSVHLFNMALQRQGVLEGAVGVSTALQAIGITVGALSSASLLRAFGSARVLAVASLVPAAALVLGWLLPGFGPAAALRFLLAAGVGTGVSVAEYILVARAGGGRRTSLIALYNTAFAIGTGAGPALVAYQGSDSVACWAIGAAASLAVVGLLPFARVRVRADGAEQPSTLQVFWLAPAAFLAAFVFGVLSNGFLSLIGLLGADTGNGSLGIENGPLLATVAFMGSILLQVPAGWVGDRFGPAPTLLATALVTAGCLASLPLAAGNPVLLAVLIFAVGGLSDVFYVSGLSLLGAVLPKDRLAAGNGCFVAFCGTGEIAGPLFAGPALQFGGTTAFVHTFVLLLIGFFVLSVRRSSGGAPVALAPGRA